MIRRRARDPFTSNAANGSNAIQLTTGQRIDFGSGASDHMYGDNTGIFVGNWLQVAAGIVSQGGNVQARVDGHTGDNFYNPYYAARVAGSAADAATAIGVVLNASVALAASGAKITSFRNGNTEKAFVDKDGNIELNGANELGVIMKSPDGTRYKLTIANGGTVTVTAL